ncbi:hypothetical protein E4U56_002780 [Claviceps arundinis]|uniref:MARVEL domain-containing protein n=1 Tax=Claviceps arundinis TaxID=1623583 RepID=A0A9P7MQJ3_9HYPO|nr:hypothetical protein E4U56_002780 [Claviceps arundinis]
MSQTTILRIGIIVLRVLQFASAAIVTGITAYFISQSDTTTWNLGRFIYSQLIAGISLLVIFVTLLPSVDAFVQIPIDIALSLLWWGVFGLLFNFTQYPCGWVFEWMNIAPPYEPQCAKFDASTAFSLAAAILFMVCGIANVFIERRRGDSRDVIEPQRRPHQRSQMHQTTREPNWV